MLAALAGGSSIADCLPLSVVSVIAAALDRSSASMIKRWATLAMSASRSVIGGGVTSCTRSAARIQALP